MSSSREMFEFVLLPELERGSVTSSVAPCIPEVIPDEDEVPPTPLHEEMIIKEETDDMLDVAETVQQVKNSWQLDSKSVADQPDEDPDSRQLRSRKSRRSSRTSSNRGCSINSYAPVDYSASGTLAAYTCDHCYQSFSSSAERYSHIIDAHTVPVQRAKRIKCKKCPETFPNRKSLNKHSTVHHMCTTCGSQFKTIIGLRRHISMVHAKATSPVKSPPTQVPSIELEITPINDSDAKQRTPKAKRYLCKVCNTTIISKAKILAHLFTEHCEELSDDTPELSCTLCEFKSLSQYGLDTHTTSHPKCEECDLRVISQSELEQHQETHKPIFEPEVEHLEVTFDGNYSDDNGADDNDNFQYESDHMSDGDLGDLFGRTQSWKKLIIINYACNICQISFASKMLLFEHSERTHGDVDTYPKISIRAQRQGGSYKCDLCKASFSYIGTLMDHKLRHRGITPFACKFCCKIYATKRNLILHCDKEHEHELEEASKKPSEGTPTDEVSMGALAKKHNPDYITPTVEDSESKRRVLLVCSVCKIRFKNNFSLYKHCVKHHINRIISPQIKQLKQGSNKCSVCGIGFRTTEILRCHLIRHFDIRPYMCKYCGKLYSNRHSLFSHLKRLHTRQLVRDGYVPRTTASQEQVNHLQEQSENPLYVCDFCNVRMKHLWELRRHIAKSHLEEAAARNQANDANKSEDELETQVVDDFYPGNDVNYEAMSCEQCNQTFFRRHLLERHLQYAHTGPNDHVRPMYQCKECGRFFRHRYELREHELVLHRGVKPYKCKHCDTAYNNRGSLYLHRKNFHPREFAKRRVMKRADNAGVERRKTITSGNFACEQCNKTMKSKEVLLKHMMIHFKVPFKCNLCPARFRRPSKLRSHYCDLLKYPHLCTYCGRRFKDKPKLLIHRSKHAKTFACEHCGKKFINQSCYVRHKAVYHEAPQFLCPECGAMFSLQCQLDRHLKNHREMKHCCSDCPRKFWDLRQLQQHRNMEHKEKRFICELCGRALSQKWHYDFHMSRHKGERNYGCEECDKSYTSANALKYHNRTRHPEKVKQKKPVQRIKKSPIVPRTSVIQTAPEYQHPFFQHPF